MLFNGVLGFCFVYTLVALGWAFVTYSTFTPTNNVWSQPWIYVCMLATIFANNICYYVIPSWLWWVCLVCCIVYVLCRLAFCVSELTEGKKLRNPVVVSCIADIACAYTLMSIFVRG